MGRTWPRSRSARSESVSARKGGPSGRALSTLGGRFLHADDQRVHASATSDSCDAPAARRSASSPSQPSGEEGTRTVYIYIYKGYSYMEWKGAWGVLDVLLN